MRKEREDMDKTEATELAARIHRHEIASTPGYLSALIVDGPMQGYTVGEAMVLEQIQREHGYDVARNPTAPVRRSK